MELEGLGISLAGRCTYVRSENAWLPWEFLNASYTCRILVCGAERKTSLAYVNPWTVVFTVSDTKVWSAIATVMRGMGSTVLLVFDAGCPELPASFLRFLEESLLKQVITRVWIGNKPLPVVPDAVFFPTGDGADAHDYLTKMPGGHLHGMSAADFKILYESVTSNNLGLVISNVGETGWTLFWHREADSVVTYSKPKVLVESLLHAAALIVRTIP